MTHEVFFILDRRFSGDLWTLSRKAPVWIIRSVHNEAVAKAVWDRKADNDYPLNGVTTFAGSEDDVDTLHGLLGTIDEHHGKSSALRPWDAIHVRGLSMDRVRMHRVAEELGLETVLLEPEENGFAIRRAARSTPP